MTVAFLLTSLFIIALPGTGALYTMSAGLSRGARASVLAAFACTLGIIPHMVAAITGLAALLNTSAMGFRTLKYAGVIYLAYMAWKTARDTSALTVETDAKAPSSIRVITSGILINILNPKLTIFFLAFLPQFVHPGANNAALRMIELSAIFMLLTFIVFVLYGVFAASVRNHLISRPRILTWMRRSFAGGFLALGAKLAVTSK